jgi:hypothetical protein
VLSEDSEIYMDGLPQKRFAETAAPITTASGEAKLAAPHAAALPLERHCD